MKKRIILSTIIFLFIGLLYGCKNYGLEFKEEYEALNAKSNASGKIHRTITIDKDNPFIKVSEDEIVKKIEDKETFYVYFGDPLCPWCRSVLEKFIEVAKKHDIKKVYYVKIWDEDGKEVVRDKYTLNDDNTLNLELEGTSGYKKLLEYFDNVLSDYNLTSKDGSSISTNEKRIFAPNYFYVENGKTIKMVEGISEKQTDARAELTEDILSDEETIFEEFFN